MSVARTEATSTRRLTGRQLFFIVLGRLAINTSLRMMYPFLPAFARGLNLSTTQVADLIAVRSLLGGFSPLFGSLSERFGRRPIILAGLGLFTVSCVVVVIWPSYWPLAVTLMFTAVAKIVFDPAVHAAVGDRVPYEERGRVTATIELAWAGSMFIGAPLVGVFIARLGWQGPFLLLTAVGAVSLLGVWLTMPRTGRPHGWSKSGNRAQWGIVVRRPAVWGVCLFTLLIAIANDLFFINYGVWLEEQFAPELGRIGRAVFGSGLGLLGGVGTVSAIVGLGETMGEGFIWGYVDRIGKRRLSLLAGTAMTAVYLLIPLNQAFGWSMTAVFLLFFAFEVSFVSIIPLVGELVPEARAIVLSLLLASMSIGRAAGAWMGPRVWAWGGITANSWGAAALAAVGLLLFFYLVPELTQTKTDTSD